MKDMKIFIIVFEKDNEVKFVLLLKLNLTLFLLSLYNEFNNSE